MSDNKFPYIFFNKTDRDSDFSEREYKSKDFILQKYEKFKPKSDKIENLKGAENKVKKLLSLFLRKIENERRNSFGKYYKSNKKERHSLLKKVKTMSNNQNILNNSFNNNSINLERKSRNSVNKIIDISQNYYFSPQKNKVKYKLSPNKCHNESTPQKALSIFNVKRTKKKNSDKNVGFKSNETTTKKSKFDDFVKKTKTIDIFNRNKTGIQIKGKDNNIFFDKKNSVEINNISTRIKMTKSVLENDKYINFKKDYLNRSIKERTINLKSSLKKKKGILRNKNKFKRELLNESAHNSILSDFSDNNLKNSSLDTMGIKNNLLHKKVPNNSISNRRISANFMINRKPRVSFVENLNLSNKKNSILDSVSPRKTIIDNKLDLKKAETQKKRYKRATTNVNNQKPKSQIIKD